MNMAQQASAKEARSGSTADAEEVVRARAYAIWEDEGRPEGRHLDHWRRASDEVAAPEATAAPSDGIDARRAAGDDVAAPKKKAATSNGAKRAAKPKGTGSVETRPAR